MDTRSNLRLVLALTISFVFIFVWSKYFSGGERVEANGVVRDTNKSSNATTRDGIASRSGARTMDGEYRNKKSKTILTVKSNKFDVQMDNLGRIAQVVLKEDKYNQPRQDQIFTHIGHLLGIIKKEKDSRYGLQLFSDDQGAYPLEMRFIDQKVNDQAFEVDYTSSVEELELGDTAKTVVLTQRLEDLEVQKRITIHPDLRYELQVVVNRPVRYVISSGMRPTADGENYAFNGVILKKEDGRIEKIEDKEARVSGESFSRVRFVASVDRYYTSLLFDKKSQMEVTVGAHGDGYPLPFVSIDSNDVTLGGYIGPKDYAVLKNVDDGLADVVEYGVITFFARYIFMLLSALYSFVGNWGVAIILLVVIIRVVMFPMTFKGMISMQKLKDLAPKMKEIQDKYKGDPQKLQVQMMDLYRKHGANPLGGCLPLILQIPVFFAIYRVLYNAVELKYASFLFWIDDLSVMDPYFILPVLMGASMYIQQHLTPTTVTDPMQQRVFKLLPVVFTLFMVAFPAGLTLYWTINNVFSILQQLAINKMMYKKTKMASMRNKLE